SAGDLNLARYVRNQPNSFVDPTGWFNWNWCAAGGLGVGAFFGLGGAAAACVAGGLAGPSKPNADEIVSSPAILAGVWEAGVDSNPVGLTADKHENGGCVVWYARTRKRSCVR